MKVYNSNSRNFFLTQSLYGVHHLSFGVISVRLIYLVNDIFSLMRSNQQKYNSTSNVAAQYLLRDEKRLVMVNACSCHKLVTVTITNLVTLPRRRTHFNMFVISKVLCYELTEMTLANVYRSAPFCRQAPTRV